MKTVTETEEESIVSFEEWMNVSTGEVRKFAVKNERIFKDTNFYKVFLLDFLALTKELTKGRIKVLYYILENIDPSTNQFIANFDTIVTETKAGRATVSEAIKFLLEVNFLSKRAQSVYVVNAKYLVKGDHNKRMGLMKKYEQMPYNKSQAEEWEQQARHFEDEQEEKSKQKIIGKLNAD